MTKKGTFVMTKSVTFEMTEKETFGMIKSVTFKMTKNIMIKSTAYVWNINTLLRVVLFMSFRGALATRNLKIQRGDKFVQ
jgi:hypothetical protein